MTRKCPRECAELRPKTSRNVEVDACPSCGGIWFDAGEFDDLVGERFAGEAMESYLALTSVEPEEEPARCPVDDAAMMVVNFDGLELDWCPECHGIWIDGDERSELARRPSTSTAEPEVQTIERTTVGEVYCAACGEVVPRSNAMALMEAYWCEGCVVRGDYPGGYGPPISSRLAEAARAMSEARDKLDRKRLRNDGARVLNARVRRGFGRHPPPEALGFAVESVARTVRNLFSKKSSDED